MIKSIFKRLFRFDSRICKYYLQSLYKDKPVAPFPFDIYIEPTNFCNLRCSICQSKDLTRKRGMMGLDMFKELVDSLNGNLSSSMIFQFAGESLLNDDLPSMIRYAKDNGVSETRLNTNGMLLDDYKIIKLIESGLDVLFIDFECNKDFYDRYRVGGDYGTVEKNIKRFMELKKILNMNKPLVRIFMLESKDTKEIDLNLAYLEWYTIVDRVDIYSLGTQGNQVDVVDALDTYKHDCVDPFKTVFICWNGDVVPCCTDMDASMIMGNIKNESLLSIWNNDKYNELRDAIRNKKLYRYPLCNKCMR